MSEYIYKIRNKDTGLFSSGTSDIRWQKIGKVWKTIGHLKSHIVMMKDLAAFNQEYENAEIVEYEIKETKTIDI